MGLKGIGVVNQKHITGLGFLCEKDGRFGCVSRERDGTAVSSDDLESVIPGSSKEGTVAGWVHVLARMEKKGRAIPKL